MTTLPLVSAASTLERLLTSDVPLPTKFSTSQIAQNTTWVAMRDGVRLATDLYLPPVAKAPAIAMRTPYGRKVNYQVFMEFATCGYVIVAQDCRGTGDSEPDVWDFLIYEPEDGFDLVEWISAQSFFDGFVGSCGGSYVGATQVYMAMHPRMSAIAPEVCGVVNAPRTGRLYNFVNSYSRCVGKGPDKVPVDYAEMERRMVGETLAGGFFNDPLELPLSQVVLQSYPHLLGQSPTAAKLWLWDRFNRMPPADRADLVRRVTGDDAITFATMEPLASVFGRHLSHGTASRRSPNAKDIVRALRAVPLFITGWYDWGLGNTLTSWELVTREAISSVSSQTRLLIAPSAHNVPGYHEGEEEHPELGRAYRTGDIAGLLMCWYQGIREHTIDKWPPVIYYLMGANRWYAASQWPPCDASPTALYLAENGSLTASRPGPQLAPDQFIYDPEDPTPTLGGSVVSYVYPPGSVDVSKVQERKDVLSYTTEPFGADVDVVGPLEAILYASSSAVDTDFVTRLSDVFPDGRAIQLQTGFLRARYRDPDSDGDLLEPGRVYRFEIDMWATANRFKVGHRLRLDIASADFPKYDRNTNRGGTPGPAVRATQTIYHDATHPSHLTFSILERGASSMHVAGQARRGDFR